MTMATYQLCKHPEKMARVKAEIKELWPDIHGPMPKAAQLEKLPYLVRAIFESRAPYEIMRNDYAYCLISTDCGNQRVSTYGSNDDI
jgi:hypothetical protein